MTSTRPERQVENRAGRSTVADDAPQRATEPDAPVSCVAPVPGLVHLGDNGELRRRGDEPNDPLGGSRVSPEVDGALARLQGRGRPLPTNIARSMGEAMGADLGAVRIHTGDEPAGLARSVQATAFTLGRDIFFGAGSYAPETPSGQRLLAHELAHTVQQVSAGGSVAGPVIGRAADPAEAAADRVADGVMRVLRRRADRAPDEASNSEQAAIPRTAPLGLLRTVSARNAGNRGQLRRKVGFEAELMVPSLGPSAGQLTYKKDAWLSDDIKSFLDGGVPYGTDLGGKAEGADVRLDSDHGGSVDRTPIVNKLIELGWVTGGAPHEPRTKIEFVTAAVDELAPGSDKRLVTVAQSLKTLLTQTLAQAKSGGMTQLGAPAKAGFKTGVPDFDFLMMVGADYSKLEGTIKEYLKNGIQDDVYLQATVGVIPSAMLKFFAQAALPGGKVELAPSSAARQQLLAMVSEVIAAFAAKFLAAPEGHWVKKLGATSSDAFLGLLGLTYSYMLADTLHQTSGGTLTTVKNAVPFLIKMSPFSLIAKTAPQSLKDDPPPKDFIRGIGDLMKKTKYLQLAYWVEETRKDEPTAVSDGKLPEKLDARPRPERLITGDYTDFIEKALLGSGGAASVVTGKVLPGPDKPPTNTGDVNLFHELYNQSGIPLEYRAITKHYKIAEVLPALNEIIQEVRQSSLNGLTEEQQTAVKEAFKSDV